ncbi:MAG TPA: amidohydrolase family protein [Candidatus Methylacidiphilales bacterium]|nr:amidohydrolase family protein [Candidatus Methylacidiphilales bacterium]
MLYLADIVLPISSPPLARGAVRVEGAEIIAVGPASELPAQPGEPVTDLGASTLLPGLINAHCHLDFTRFKGALSPKQGFTEWIKTINALRRSFTTRDYIDAIAEGFEMLARGGVTTVANIEAFPELLPQLPVPPLRTWWFLELIDVRSRINEDETLLGALSFFEKHPEWLGGFGLSPHAPYTASVDLYRLARTCGEKYGMLSTTHIAESIEEHEMFSHARGPLHDFLAGLGRDNSDCGHGSALSHLVEHGVIGPNCIIAHLNYLQDYDYELVARSGASVVHCPKCHTYFGHAPFPMKALREHGVNICLGTDSLASNNAFDMRSEMREAQAMHGLGDREVLEMVLLNGARALGQAGKLGQISRGSVADLVAFPHAGAPDPDLDLYRQVVQSHEEPNLLLVNGRCRARQ